MLAQEIYHNIISFLHYRYSLKKKNSNTWNITSDIESINIISTFVQYFFMYVCFNQYLLLSSCFLQCLFLLSDCITGVCFTQCLFYSTVFVLLSVCFVQYLFYGTIIFHNVSLSSVVLFNACFINIICISMCFVQWLFYSVFVLYMFILLRDCFTQCLIQFLITQL